MAGEIIDYFRKEEEALSLPSEEIKRRMAEKAALVAELEARNPSRKTGASPEPPSAPAPALTKRITADADKLGDLVLAARGTEDEAVAVEEMARATRLEAQRARQRLDDYMRETGLA